ncbi:MAG: lysophospholipase, partial [Deltaproteobacteria bacterium]|nr:lysophospholipase [Deltaproteobacteria bacterium]
MQSKDWISSRDGTKLYIKPALVDNPKHTIVLVHGFAEHIGRYQDLIERLNQSNMNVIGLDFRGHGQSDGQRGYIDSLSQYEEDLDAAVQTAKQKTGTQKVTILAHSMGALIASCYAVNRADQVSGLILSSPLIALSVKVPYWKQQVGQIMSTLWPTFSMPNTMDPKYLSHDPKTVQDYEKDPLVFHEVNARWFEQVTGFKGEAIKIAAKIQTPMLVQLSDEEQIVSFDASKEWFDHIPGADSSVKVYEGFYHEIY